MIGESGVGKTAIVSRMSEETFIPNHVPTVGSQFVPIDMVLEGQRVVFELWDTAGQEVYRSLVGFYTREACGAFVVFDVTSKVSFDSLLDWIRFIQNESPGVKIVVFGNKIDLETDRVISTQQIVDFAKIQGLEFFEGSAKTGQGVGDAFSKMGELLLNNYKVKPVASPAVQVKGKAEKKEGCC
jgi:small GTP-binding protein